MDRIRLFIKLSALQGSRTPNLLIRSQVLYPVKLGAHFTNTLQDMTFLVLVLQR